MLLEIYNASRDLLARFSLEKRESSVFLLSMLSSAVPSIVITLYHNSIGPIVFLFCLSRLSSSREAVILRRGIDERGLNVWTSNQTDGESCFNDGESTNDGSRSRLQGASQEASKASYIDPHPGGGRRGWKTRGKQLKKWLVEPRRCLDVARLHSVHRDQRFPLSHWIW